jgi:LacI family transcriptional regulator
MHEPVVQRERLQAGGTITLDDVAQAAGVSTATVSRVINHFPRVAEQTRRRVLDAIERLEYTPNFAGRMLATQRTHTIGLIITDITNPFYPAVVRGVEAAALSLGFNVLLYDTGEDKQREAQALQLLRERQVDGLVVCSSRLGKARLAQLAQGKTPLVFINSQPAPSSVGSVETDHEAGMRSAVEHLARLGHRRIAYLGGPHGSQVQQRRLKAFRDATNDLGVQPEDGSQEPTVDGGSEGTRELLARRDPAVRATALITYNDLMASGALLAARAVGWRVPEELSLIGHDDIPMAALLTPALTTVRQPMQELGSRAVAILVAHLQSTVTANPTVLTLHPQLIVRASTAPLTTSS